MLNPEEVSRRLQEHFETTSTDEFVSNVSKFSPELIRRKRLPAGDLPNQTPPVLQLGLPQAQPTQLPLKAYLASALTNLNKDEKLLVIHISDVIATICDEVGIELYEPRKKTDPVHDAAVSPAEVFEIDRERVLNSDLVIHLCHFPSTGSGEELDFAYNALVPIILVSHNETRVSRMITGLPGLKFQLQYSEPEDLRSELRDQLIELRPLLEVRKLAFASYDTNIIGDRIRAIREELRLTRQDVASAVPYLTVDLLRQIEESTDKNSNPTVLQLRQIATVLKTTVADLVEPDLGSRLAVALQDWVNRRRAARHPNISEQDKNRIMRRLLYRILESLEEESEES